ncbi:MAG TPA: WecB/TagA/CpsF family glycosyltransferase [Hyphomicrobium sp.]|uniref:WecB/TagA/CpsF family glycosyltransferase n=1 Tax=Hyphomicrobium sp. TaxID=82 RepID=UPI002C0276DB|nr:WecB/TagA/CpsF family glycosyltransferase [Hyphomicrobium sp.]HRN87146.1 WecB/TagA/CpsF family glycosyltransferase [Hyphomicrobium sp.]
MSVQTLSLKEASCRICDDVASGKSFSVFTLNLDHVVKLRANPAFRAVYERAGIVLADGFPIVLAGRLQGRCLSRTTGADLIVPLCEEASRRGLPVFLLGSTSRSLAGAERHLTNLISNLDVAGTYAPDQGFAAHSEQADEAIEAIRKSGARICFIALGAPKQEIFADRCAREIEGVSFLCIGAGLDFLAGHQKRAPKVFQVTGLEWLWRMLLNPGRLARRYAECLAVLPSVLLDSLSRRSAQAGR